MIILICGGRDYNDYDALNRAMTELLPFRPKMVIEGGATGADRLGRQWAIDNGVHYATVPALWDHFGKSAGYRRNAVMLMLEPSYCIALPGGRGTANMIDLCQRAEVTVWQPYN